MTAAVLRYPIALAAGSLLTVFDGAHAGEVLEEVIVFARSEEQIGRAGAASEGAVGGADLSVRPLLRVAELLEVVPGLIAVQHSGSGKANQYFLRGFNLGHGTDFSARRADRWASQPRRGTAHAAFRGEVQFLI